MRCVLITCTNQDKLSHCIDEYSSMLYMRGNSKKVKKKEGKIDRSIFQHFVCGTYKSVDHASLCFEKWIKSEPLTCLLDFSILLIFHSFEWLFTDNTFVFERKTTLKATLAASWAFFFFTSMIQWTEIRHFTHVVCHSLCTICASPLNDGGCAACSYVDWSRILKESGCELHVVWEQCIILKAVAMNNWRNFDRNLVGSNASKEVEDKLNATLGAWNVKDFGESQYDFGKNWLNSCRSKIVTLFFSWMRYHWCYLLSYLCMPHQTVILPFIFWLSFQLTTSDTLWGTLEQCSFPLSCL